MTNSPLNILKYQSFNGYNCNLKRKPHTIYGICFLCKVFYAISLSKEGFNAF